MVHLKYEFYNKLTSKHLFLHKHPYKPFIQDDTTKLIVGTLPPPRFSTGDLLEKDVNFCYGSYYNSLWLFIDKIHKLGLRYDNSQEAIDERKRYLIKHKIGVCDIVESAERDKIDASDLGMKNIVLRDVVAYLKQYPRIDTLEQAKSRGGGSIKRKEKDREDKHEYRLIRVSNAFLVQCDPVHNKRSLG